MLIYCVSYIHPSLVFPLVNLFSPTGHLLWEYPLPLLTHEAFLPRGPAETAHHFV